jgi:hypothetical protein
MSALVDVAPLDVVMACIMGVVGYAAGVAHVRSLRRVTDLFLAGRGLAIVLQVGRFIALGGILLLAALGGAPVLLVTAAGVLVGRSRALRREST